MEETEAEKEETQFKIKWNEKTNSLWWFDNKIPIRRPTHAEIYDMIKAIQIKPKPSFIQHEEYKLRVQCPNCKDFIWIKLDKKVYKDE